jgi:hypothetical protein
VIAGRDAHRGPPSAAHGDAQVSTGRPVVAMKAAVREPHAARTGTRARQVARRGGPTAEQPRRRCAIAGIPAGGAQVDDQAASSAQRWCPGRSAAGGYGQPPECLTRDPRPPEVRLRLVTGWPACRRRAAATLPDTTRRRAGATTTRLRRGHTPRATSRRPRSGFDDPRHETGHRTRVHEVHDLCRR